MKRDNCWRLGYKEYDDIANSCRSEEAEAIKYNGKEYEDSFGLNMYEYGARNYDPAVGRFFNMDKFAEKTVETYQYTRNNPINKIEIAGHFDIDQKIANKYPKFANYLRNGIQELANNPNIMNGLMKYGSFSEQEIKSSVLAFGQGSIKINVQSDVFYYGYYPGGVGYPININEKLISQFENSTNKKEQALYLLVALTTILHETVHYGEWKHTGYSAQNKYEFKTADGYPHSISEIGNAFEIDVFWKGIVDSVLGGGKFGDEGLEFAEGIMNSSFESLPTSIQSIINSWLEENPNIKVFIID